ncbi:DotH/IcmK family type IV secretion protein [Caedibacter taeniospiralis]|uniref:DotH/IcmK family type IV secretion protein n=1 Tax=Caedibacter taeniospiralis TaxID=28907 RepID=UPI001E2DD3EA|nr:DotH/IcmK family type IV secretion protein [Caedibacter taeniospiralis]
MKSATYLRIPRISWQGLLGIGGLLLMNMACGSDHAVVNSIVNNMFPLTPGDIEQSKTEISSRQKAAAVMPAMSDVNGVSRIVVANTKPGFVTAPPNVRLGIGVVSSVIFTDSQGMVWPVTSYVIGDAENFAVNWDKKGGIIMLQSKKPYANTNMAVMLQGRTTPITLMLQSTQKEWDYELYIRVAKPEDDTQLNGVTQSSYLLSLLSGIVPAGAKKLSASGAENVAQFWLYQNHYLILTSGTLISPSYVSHIEDKSMGVTNVYEIVPTPVVMISNDSGLQKINIKDA